MKNIYHFIHCHFIKIFNIFSRLSTEQNKNIKGLFSRGYFLKCWDQQAETNLCSPKVSETQLESVNQQTMTKNWLSLSLHIWTLLWFLWLHWH